MTHLELMEVATKVRTASMDLVVLLLCLHDGKIERWPGSVRDMSHMLEAAHVSIMGACQVMMVVSDAVAAAVKAGGEGQAE